MRRFSAFFLATGLFLAISAGATVHGSTLYQWTTKDGTPTYSPDPPPAGVEYQVVGPDLKPLAKNIDLTKPVAVAPNTGKRKSVAKAPTTVAPTTAKAAKIITAPTPLETPVKKPATPWKPVRYANDPKPRVSDTVTEAVRPDPVALARRSPECNRAKQKMVLLESQFSEALTDEQMDRAMLRLREQNLQLKSACRIP